MNTSPIDREGFAAFLLRMRATGLDNRKLISAFEATPRRNFLRSEFHGAAWSKGSIPIDCGETIESVDFQARVINALDIQADSRVLEIGTGSGYTAAVMARLAKRVYTIERYKTLHDAALAQLTAQQLANVVALHGDGSRGVSDGPFDRIVVWAAFDAIPRQFIEQLVSSGVLICAIGAADEPQELVHMTKVGSRYERQDLGNVRMQMLNPRMPKKL
ncbi:protein-L-isoaspartate(D-aspartate) O-methyltransferase [Ahrensia marina]|uniref:Protein-L-isoaspartate O-methyltransferase n=1 Tax=Ahrensia marina TaxID=1514904 RepID=A0A0M9GNA0_9HYPH|nr:protein-L-isoaspartate(D-aspartate) O-methyltransferase [Ahrensia marina]KPB01499.1 protein-L-isoaspartate O-methyltransferase [Ahrensia marina]